MAFKAWFFAAALLGAASTAGAARAEISIPVNCPGHWVTTSKDFSTIKVCERGPSSVSRPLPHRHVFLHRRHWRHLIARHVPIAPSAPQATLVAAAAAETKSCLTLLCPQFILVGVGY